MTPHHLEQPQRNYKKTKLKISKRYKKKTFFIPEGLEMYSGNWFIFIWNDKVFWKKIHYLVSVLTEVLTFTLPLHTQTTARSEYRV